MPSLKTLFVLFVFAVGGYFAWERFKPTQPTQPTPVVITPEEEVAKSIGKNPIHAEDLARIAEKYPDLLTKALKDRKISVRGVLKDAMVRGVGSNDLILDLEGNGKRSVCFVSDINRKRLVVGDEAQYKFFKQGREIFVAKSYISKAERIIRSRNNVDFERLYCRELEIVELTGIFQHITSTAIRIEWIQPNF